jgi:hypothetical protein
MKPQKEKADGRQPGDLKNTDCTDTHSKPESQTQARFGAHLRLVASDANRREREQIELAEHLAYLGGRHVLEALRAVRRGQTIISVLQDFQTLPRWRGLRVVGRD